MSMIDTSDKSLERSPFNDLNGNGDVGQNPFEGLELSKKRPSRKLTTRSAVYAAFIMIAVCLMTPVTYGGIREILVSCLWTLGAAAVYILLWAFTMRFFESPDMMPVSIVLNLVPSVLLEIFFKDKFVLEGLVFIGAGLTALSLEASDEKEISAGKKDKSGFTGIDFLSGEVVKYTEFVKADIGFEVIIPFIFAVVSSLAGVIVTGLVRGTTHMQGKGVSLIVSALVLVGLSSLISLITGKDIIFSSSEMSDASILPVTTYKHLRSFLLRRSRFFVSIILIGAGCLVCDLINVKFSLGFCFMKHILSALLMFAFAFIRGRQSKHRIQFATELSVIYALCVTRVETVADLVLIALLATFIDILITSFMYTRNRRLIMSHRSLYVAGMPLELITASVIFMAAEVVLSYWGVVIV